MLKLGNIAHAFHGLAQAGRGAGARHGQWHINLVESGDVREDGWLNLEELREIDLVRSSWTEKHLLRPLDILIAARAGSAQLALTPPDIPETVAGVTLLVVRAREADEGMAHYLWCYLTSSFGRRELVKRMTVNATITSLSASAARDIKIPLPATKQLERVANLVEASEEEYTAAITVAKLRREMVRDSVISEIVSRIA